jgi:hypothetical protein
LKALHRPPGARWIGPAALLLLALVPRLWQIDMTRFFNDQVEHIQSAAVFIDSGHVPLSSGFTFHIDDVQIPPLITYLLTLPVLISRNPVWVSGCVAALDAFSALFVYLAARRISGNAFAAMAAGALYALNPSAITWSREIWNPNLVPFFAAVGLWGSVEFAVTARSTPLGISLAAILCAAQLHIVHAIYLVIWGATAIWARRKVRPAPVIAGGALGLLPVVPYVYLQWRTGWIDIIKVLRYVNAPKTLDLTAVDTVATMAGPRMFSWLIPTVDASIPAGYDILNWLLIVLVLVGIGCSLAAPRQPRLIVSCWLGLPVLASLRHTADVSPHYLLAALPAIAILQGLALDESRHLLSLLRCHSFALQRVAASAVLLIITAWLLGDYAHFQGVVGSNVRQVQYGMPLRYSMEAAQLVRQDAAGQPFYLGVPFLYNHTVPYLAGRDDQRWYWDRSAFVFPRGAAWYLIQNDSFGYQLLAEHFGPPLASVPNEAGQPEFALFHLSADAWQPLFRGAGFLPLSGDAGGGIALQGYLGPDLAAGQKSEALLLWQARDPSRIPDHLSQFAHLVEAAGQTVSTDPDLWDIREPWRAGDMVATGFDLAPKPDTPTGGYWLETGFYETFSQKSLGPTIRIGPLRVAGVQPAVSGNPLGIFGDAELALAHADWRGGEVILDWRADRKPKAGYTVFVHAVDGSGTLVAQQDGIPQDGAFPTTLWEPGDVVRDVHHLGLAPRAGIHLEIGLYTQPDVKRLPAYQPGGQEPADHIDVNPPV